MFSYEFYEENVVLIFKIKLKNRFNLFQIDSTNWRLSTTLHRVVHNNNDGNNNLVVHSSEDNSMGGDECYAKQRYVNVQ